MKSKRVNWRSKAINRLQEDLGMTKEQSVNYYNRVYRNALKTTGGHIQNLNTTKEVYATLFYQTASTFQLGPNQSVTLNPIIKNASNVAQGIALARMDNFFDKYKSDKQLQTIKQEYMNGTISRNQFNERVRDWKATSHRYLISGSK